MTTKSFAPYSIALLTLCAIPDLGVAQEKMFNGVYGGVELGRQKIIGGSFVDGIDFLSVANRAVLSFQAGVRYQFGFGLVVGVEGSAGVLDGNLSLDDPPRSLNISYENSGQSTLGAVIGFTPGSVKTLLVFTYVSEATRKFDVTIQQAGMAFPQRDEQGMLRYGGGVEGHLSGHLHFRVTVGSGRADFGSLRTNINVSRGVEFAASMLFRV